MPRNESMEWLRIRSAGEIETVLRPALTQLQFNTCSGFGHRDKQQRLLTLVGERPSASERTHQVLGVIFVEQPALQQQAIDLIASVYADRHNGKEIYTWMPRVWED